MCARFLYQYMRQKTHFGKTFVHSHNLVLALGGGQKSTTGTRNFKLRNSQVIKREQICLNQCLISIDPFPPHSEHTFYLPLFNSISIRELFLCRKNIGGVSEGAVDSPCISKLHPCQCECHVTAKHIIFSIYNIAVLIILT